MSVSLVARQEGVTASLLFQRQKLDLQGALMAVSAEEAVVSASELTAAHAEIAKLPRVPGKKTLENEILKETVEHAAEKVDGVLALVALGRTTKIVFRALGVARSLLDELHHRCEDWRVGRKGRTLAGYAQLHDQIREQITDLPNYGYRRAFALVKRQRNAQGRFSVRLPRDGAAALLLPKAPPTAPVQQKARGQGNGWAQ